MLLSQPTPHPQTSPPGAATLTNMYHLNLIDPQSSTLMKPHLLTPVILCLFLVSNACKKTSSSVPTASVSKVSYTGDAITWNELSFSSDAIGAKSYLWSFGDGTTSVMPAPAHRFEKAGIFNVTLTLDGDTARRSGTTVTVIPGSIFGIHTWKHTLEIEGAAPVSYPDTSFAVSYSSPDHAIALNAHMPCKYSSDDHALFSNYWKPFFELLRYYRTARGVDSMIFEKGMKVGPGTWEVHRYQSI